MGNKIGRNAHALVVVGRNINTVVLTKKMK